MARTEMSEQNAEWLENRPLWEQDKSDPELCKHPKRWLSYSNECHSTPKWGWINMAYMRLAMEIENSQRRRRAARAAKKAKGK